MIKKIHYTSGLILTTFISIHLFNHLYSLAGAGKHIMVMNALRHVYRNVFVETLLLFAISIQIISGIKLFINKREEVSNFFEKLQIWSGLYMAFFLILHLGAVIGGRYYLHLDTNFYYGVAGLNTFPFNLFFIPYYGLAIVAVFTHIASIHNRKMKVDFLGLTPVDQSRVILILGFLVTFVTFYGLTDHFNGVIIPKEYEVLVGK